MGVLMRNGVCYTGVGIGESEEGNAKTVRATYDVTPATKPHAVDSFIYFNNTVYKVTSAISIGDTIAVGTNITADTGLSVDTPMYIDGKPDSGGGSDVTKSVLVTNKLIARRSGNVVSITMKSGLQYGEWVTLPSQYRPTEKVTVLLYCSRSSTDYVAEAEILTDGTLDAYYYATYPSALTQLQSDATIAGTITYIVD